MTRQQPPKPSAHVWRVPKPADAALLAEYMDLGWIENGEELIWSHARGTPVHPGDHLDVAEWKGPQPPAAMPLLRLLPREILSEGMSRLPEAADCDDAYLEVPVMVLIRFQRMASKKGRSRHSFWSAEDARLIGLAAEPPRD